MFCLFYTSFVVNHMRIRSYTNRTIDLSYIYAILTQNMCPYNKKTLEFNMFKAVALLFWSIYDVKRFLWLRFSSSVSVFLYICNIFPIGITFNTRPLHFELQLDYLSSKKMTSDLDRWVKQDYVILSVDHVDQSIHFG